ncbi:MAG: arginase family protein, partial [Kiloniellales bacterium]|nr:arginase family protein [Kiloniellales bacterium]
GLLAKLQEALNGERVYLCWDMDFFDASAAPGVCDPTWGGPSAHEGLELLKGLKGLDLIACDINTVTPPLDPQGMTAHLAAVCGLIMLHLIAINA